MENEKEGGISIKIGIRGHDVYAANIKDLCRSLSRLNMDTIQFSPGKSFPKMELTEASVKGMKRILDAFGIHVAVYGCYVDPLSEEGESCFLRQMEFAAILEAGVIGTETALHQQRANETEGKYRKIEETFFRWIRRAEEQKIPVGIEAVTGFPIHSVEKTERLLVDLSSDFLKIIWDPANLIEKRNAGQQRDIFHYGLQHYGHRIAAMHYKERPDICYEASIAYCMHRDIPILLEGIPEERVLEAVAEVNFLGNCKKGL